MTLNPTNGDTQAMLKASLQNGEAGALEHFTAAAIGRLLGVEVAVAKSGFQYGGDAGTAGRQGRRLRIECKKYADSTAPSRRELLGEIDHALARDPALEAWVLVATREVSEDIEQDLAEKGEKEGVPIVVLDFKSSQQSSLAVLCASAPDLVEGLFSVEAATLAKFLQPSSAEAIERLRRDLAAWSLGFGSVRDRSHAHLEEVWLSPRASHASLGQNAAGGASSRKIRRQAVHKALDAWWSDDARKDAPIAVVGWDGVGKTWATLDWLVDRRDLLPIALIMPSSACATLDAGSEMAVKRFVADRLYELTGSRSSEHWLRRLERLLQRPSDEGPALALFFDGLNQEPSVPWLPLLKVLQGEAFAGRVRIIASTRRHFYEEKLGRFRGLVVPATMVEVDIYDATSGGEFDQMLAFEGLTRDALPPDVVELARTPRLFQLVVRFGVGLVAAGQVTVHRLLWEYGRDSLGTRTGRSFSETEWREWLREVASRYLQGVQEFSLKTLAETATRADLTAREVSARLSDIIDSRFTIAEQSGSFRLDPNIVAHALGTVLLEALEAIAPASFEAVDAEATRFLDPIAGIDQRAEILRAAVSIWVERGEASGPVAGVLVTSWLQTQNIPDVHRYELRAFAALLPDALLDAIEHSRTRTHASARSWAMRAFRSIKDPRPEVLAALTGRSRRWCSTVSRGIRPGQGANADFEKERSERFRSRIGADASGPAIVLGVPLEIVDWDDGVLSSIVPSLLEGLPLVQLLSVFEAAAVAMAVGGRQASWKGLKWLVYLNGVDPHETTVSLRQLSASMLTRTPENSISPLLAPRTAALLLWLTGTEEDDVEAGEIDPGLENPFNYERDYLAKPSQSIFELERRHVEQMLTDFSLPLVYRIQRIGDLWLDPAVEPPASFVSELRAAALEIDVEKLDRHSGHTVEDHSFEEVQPALARCAPDVLVELLRRKMRCYPQCPPDSRYWSAARATSCFLVADSAERATARTLRSALSASAAQDDRFAATQLLLVELNGQTAFEQAETIIDADPEDFLRDFSEVLLPLSEAEADVLITRHGAETRNRRRNLLYVLTHVRMSYSESGWAWLLKVTSDPDDELRSIAFRGLALSDPERFGHALFSRGWAWEAIRGHWESHYGSGAIIEGTRALPFEQVVPRLASWRLLEAARTRGAEPVEVRLAAAILTELLKAPRLSDPDPGAMLSVNKTEDHTGAFRFSVSPRPSQADPEDPVAAWRRALDVDGQLEAHRTAGRVAVARIEAARAAGASLYLTDVSVDDIELPVLHCPDLVADWIDGLPDVTNDFKRRVHLAEGFYLSLAEALLRNNDHRGQTLWKALGSVLQTEFSGGADLNERLHLPLRLTDSELSKQLRDELLALDTCHTDRDLFEVAIAAAFNDKTEWLRALVEQDAASDAAWRRKRAIVLEGLFSENHLPVPLAWPGRELQNGYEHLRRKAARHQYAEACARHWWQVYLHADGVAEACAAWTLFQRSADRRAWTWVDLDADSITLKSELFHWKMSHFRLNRSRLRRAMANREKNMDARFLDLEIASNVAPWRVESSVDRLKPAISRRFKTHHF